MSQNETRPTGTEKSLLELNESHALGDISRSEEATSAFMRDGHIRESEAEAAAALGLAGLALTCLLDLVEGPDRALNWPVACFLSSIAGRGSFDIYLLRAVNRGTADHMMNCLQALRLCNVDLSELIPDGAARLERVSIDWGFN